MNNFSMNEVVFEEFPEIPEIPPFEGPEKKIEVDFVLSPHLPEGLRKVSVDDWKILLAEINCSILSVIENEYCDAYILSESSLFVYSSKVIIKTCGQITLLKCLPYLLKYAQQVEAEESRVTFQRRNLLFPEEQFTPHTSFDEEVSYLKRHFIDGEAYIFGPHNCDHHYMFVYQNAKFSLPSKSPNNIEVLMTGLDRTVMKQFYRDKDFVSVEELTKRSKIQSLYKASTLIDAHAFDPLGYSLNTLKDGFYSTIHITPQPECSYVSFETNDFNPDDCHSLVKYVIDIFKPQSFTVLVNSDSAAFQAPENENEQFSGFYFRGSARHNFVNTGNVLSWYSFREVGTHSPVLSPSTSFSCKDQIQAALALIQAERHNKMHDEDKFLESSVNGDSSPNK